MVRHRRQGMEARSAGRRRSPDRRRQHHRRSRHARRVADGSVAGGTGDRELQSQRRQAMGGRGGRRHRGHRPRQCRRRAARGVPRGSLRRRAETQCRQRRARVLPGARGHAGHVHARRRRWSRTCIGRSCAVSASRCRGRSRWCSRSRQNRKPEVGNRARVVSFARHSREGGNPATSDVSDGHQ